MFTNAIELTAAGISNASRAFIAACDDIALLREALRLEEAREGGARRTRVGQLTLRIEQLVEDNAGADVVAQDERHEAEAIAAADHGDAPAAEPAEAPIAEAPAAPAEPAVLDAEPVVEEAAPAPVPEGPASTMAVALLKGIDSGNVDLVHALLTSLRQLGDKATDRQLAEALVVARKASVVAAPRRVRPAPAAGEARAVRTTTTDKLAAVIAAAGKAADGTVTIKGEHLKAAGAPSSWGEFSGSWYSTLVEPVKALGYTAKVKRVDGAQQIVLTPVAPAAE